MKNTTRYPLIQSDQSPDRSPSGQPDRGKRRTLKLLGAGMAAPFAMATLDVTASPQGAVAERAGVEAIPATTGARAHDLELHVFSSSAVLEDSVIIKNNLDERLVLDTFRPGILIFSDRFIHLPSVVAKAFGEPALVLEAGQTIALATIAEPLYGKQWARKSNLITNEFVEYLWAEDAVTTVADDAILVSAAAFVADRMAILYPKPEQSIGNSVVVS